MCYEGLRGGRPNPLIARPWFLTGRKRKGERLGEKKNDTNENRELGVSRLAGAVSDLLAESSLFETDLGVSHF